MPSPRKYNDPQLLMDEVYRIKEGLPQYNEDANWAHGVNQVFGGPKSLSYQSDNGAGWNAYNHGLNLKEQEMEMYQQRLIDALRNR